MNNIPFLPDDLRATADKVDEILSVLGTEDLPDDDWRWGVRVQVTINGWDVGYVAPYGDGWLGFYPKGLENG